MTAVRNSETRTHGTEDFIVKHKGDTYDISRFLKFHPGGWNSVSPYKGLSITEKFLDVNHSPAATYLMREYRLSGTTKDCTVEDLEVQKTDLPLINSIFHFKKCYTLTNWEYMEY
jgi:cytochrome b involved in lipid metabolism